MRPMSSLPLALLLLLPCAPTAHGAPPPPAPVHKSPASALVAGVRKIALPGVPGTLSVFGPKAFPIVEAPSGGRPAPLVAATEIGRGRAVLFGHGYFGDALKVGDTKRLVENVVRWAARRRKAPRIGIRGRSALRKLLPPSDLVFIDLAGADWTKKLGTVDAIVLPLADVSEAERRILARRLRGGLGILAGMPGWGWQQLHPREKLATDNMANRLLAPGGLVWGGEYIQKPRSGVLDVRGPAGAMTHAGWALDALIAQAEGSVKLAKADAAAAVATVTRAIREIPPDDTLLLPRLGKLLKRAADPGNLPSHAHPLTDAQGLGKLLLALELQRDGSLPPTKIRAHPAAGIFPGAVPKGAARVSRRVPVATETPGWHSTGLYAAPGEVIGVRLPPAAVAGGLRLRIGAHKDRLWGKPAWRRAPEITVERPLDAGRTTHACAFGGLIYVVVPPRCKLGAVTVAIQGAVPAPHFVLGTTSLEAWRAEVRVRPAPWAEVESQKVIITIPSAHVRTLEDPEALMRWWDRVMDADADLIGRPHERVRPERYVADEQISAGYMHAGYPIMTHLDAAQRFVDLATLSTKGDWGMFHEMGHNHQQRDWTFKGTTEVTCNLFSLYVMETVCAKGIGHGAMSPKSMAKSRALYKKGGAKFGLWKSKPFTALIMYYEMKQAFGWDAYKRVFAEYRDLADYERPKTDDERRDQWLVRMSRTVKRNLGPFFSSWGIPTSKKARDAIEDLPAWTPTSSD